MFNGTASFLSVPLLPTTAKLTQISTKFCRKSFRVAFIFVRIYGIQSLLYMKISYTDYNKIPRPIEISCMMQNTHTTMTLFATFSER
jgi:hypothetical protein